MNVLRGRLSYQDGDAMNRFLNATEQLLDRYEQAREALVLYDTLATTVEATGWKRVFEIGERLLQLAPGLERPRLWVARARSELEPPATVLESGRIVWARDGKEMACVPAGVFLYGGQKTEGDFPEFWIDKAPVTSAEHARFVAATGQEPRGRFLHADKAGERELPEFWIDRTPVTNAEYARFVAATGHTPPQHWKGPIPPGAIADHPVAYVSWHDARAYAQWAGKRLPAEEEWEKAARGADGREYPWGDWEESRCNSKEADIGTTTPVGRYSPGGDSPHGGADMAGNVWEWTASAEDEARVLRGGSWGSARGAARCACRFAADPGLKDARVGFRCVAVVSLPSP